MKRDAPGELRSDERLAPDAGCLKGGDQRPSRGEDGLFRAVRRCEGRIAWKAIVQVSPDSTIEVGAGSRICTGTVLAAQSDETGAASIQIGRRTYVGEYNNLRADGSEIVIGDSA